MCKSGAASSFRNESAEIPVIFSPKALIDGLRAIYNKDINVRTDIERSIFDETLKRFNEATAQGLAESMDPDIITDRFLQELRTNNAVFSAFKTHRMQNDVAAQLIDPVTGRLKNFDRWRLDVKGITDHYVKSWLQTEYDTAIIRAHQAADWKHFVDEADVFPNVRWMPTTSLTPDPLHEYYWQKRLTLPVNHPFWQEHRPGDRWNCKCTLQQTDEPVNAAALDGYTPPLPMPGLDNNPANDGKLFSDTHPYYTEAYPGAQEAVDNFLKKRSPSSMRRTEAEKEEILRRWDERKKIRENDIKIAKMLGVSPPQIEMSFEVANNHAVNPKYTKISTSRAEIIGKTQNCQTCVVVYEMRRRGFNVEASLWKKTDSLKTFKGVIAKHPEKAFVLPGAQFDPQYGWGPRATVVHSIKEVAEANHAPGRYHIHWEWSNTPDAHVITFEVDKKGVIQFYDPQDGERYSPDELFSTYNARIKEDSIHYYRVDNLPFDTRVADIVIKKK